MSDPFQFKPLSFYAEDERLQRIWISDRFLLKNHILADGRDEITSFNKWWHGPTGQGKAGLVAMRTIFSKVTNHMDPAIFGGGGFAELENEERRNYACEGNPCVSFWPPSSVGVLERLPLGRRKPYDAEAKAQPLMDDIVRSIKGGTLTLKPQPQDRFFIYQRYALEPLLRQDGLAESQIIEINNEMLDLWTEVYKAGSAKALETHQKALDTGLFEAVSEKPEPPEIEQLLLEPLPTVYKRYAQGYSMLLDYVRTLPPEFVAHWIVKDTPIAAFLAKLESQMLGLYLTSTKQLGLQIEGDVKGRIEMLGQSSLLRIARDFLISLMKESAMSADQRFIAVQGRPGGSKKYACNGKDGVFWATLGIEAVPVSLSGWIKNSNNTPRVFASNMVVLIDHFTEIKACVDAPLTRMEWRNLLQKSSNLGEAVKALKRDY